jgi:hypothetical protein
MKNQAKFGFITCFSMACMISSFWVSLATITPVFADEDPFSFETGKWKSFNRYKEEAKHPSIDQTSPPEESTPTSTEGPKTAESQQTKLTTPTQIAAPSRPINLPILPSINKGYSIDVQSTEEEEKAPAPEIMDIGTNPSLQPNSNNWQTTAEAVKANKDEQSGDNERTPLDVRMSFLPNPKIVPTLPPQKAKTHGRPPAQELAQKAPEEKAAPKSRTEVAACAAVDAYKKKQLEAIQSDRQTLIALQDVIAKLGLQKELNFMTDAHGNVNGQNSVKADNVDYPTTTAQK